MNNKISNMALICAILVVSIHVGLSGPVHSVAWCLKEFVAEGFARIAVPFFFVVSGYFLALRYRKSEGGFVQAWRFACWKRVRTLLVPYWFWNLCYAPLIIGIEFLSDAVAGRTLRPVAWLSTLGAITGIDLVNGPILFPLWYVRTLFVFVMISLILWPIVRRMGLCVPVLFYAISIALMRMGITLPNAFPMDGLAYFSLGLCIACGWHFSVPKTVSTILVLIALFAGGVMKWVRPEVNIISWWVPLMLLGAWGIMPSWPFPREIAMFAFPIYALHMFVLLGLQYAWHLTAFMPDAVEFLFRWSVAVGGSCLIAREYWRAFHHDWLLSHLEDVLKWRELKYRLPQTRDISLGYL